MCFVFLSFFRTFVLVSNFEKLICFEYYVFVDFLNDKFVLTKIRLWPNLEKVYVGETIADLLSMFSQKLLKLLKKKLKPFDETPYTLLFFRDYQNNITDFTKKKRC